MHMPFVLIPTKAYKRIGKKIRRIEDACKSNFIDENIRYEII